MRTLTKKWRRWGWVVFAAAVLAVFFAIRQRPPVVQVLTVEQKDLLRTIVVSGRILSPAEVNIGAQIPGTIVAMFAREGQHVKAGDLLVQLNDSAAKAQEAQALAKLAEAQAGRLSVSSLEVPAAAQELARAQTQLESEKRSAERALTLGAKQALPSSEVELAQTNLELAQSRVLAAQLELSAVSKGGSAAQRATAALALARAQVALTRVDLDSTQIRSPSDGIILQRSAEPGDVVTAGASLFVLSTSGAARALIEPDERSLADLALGQTARVSTEAFPERIFDAKLSYIAPSVNPRRGTIEVHLDIPEPPAYLRPDMTVSVEIVIGEERQVVVVPRYAVHDRAQAPWVFVVQGAHLERRPVQLGVADDTAVQVERGLEPGEVIVGEPALALQAGQRIRTNERALW
jgi:HlyD family secretion protein